MAGFEGPGKIWSGTPPIIGDDIAGLLPRLVIQYRVAVSTDPTAITTGDWRDVPLATVVRNTIAGASLVAGVLTLPAGTFPTQYWASLWWESIISAVNGQCRLFDADGATEVANSGGSLVNSLEASGGGATAINYTGISHGLVELAPSAENDYKLQVQVSRNCNYAEQSAWTSQVVAQLIIW